MSIVPVAPVVNVPSVPYPFVPPPFTDVAPLTYRDGTTYLEYLRGLNNWIQTVLIPYIADNLTALDNDYLNVANNLINTVNTALTTQTANINTALTTQQTNVNDALAAMQTSVDQAVTDVENSAITVQDPVVEGILTNPASQSRIALDGVYQQISQLDTSVSALVDSGATHDAINTLIVNGQGVTYVIPTGATGDQAQTIIAAAESGSVVVFSPGNYTAPNTGFAPTNDNVTIDSSRAVINSTVWGIPAFDLMGRSHITMICGVVQFTGSRGTTGPGTFRGSANYCGTSAIWANGDYIRVEKLHSIDYVCGVFFSSWDGTQLNGKYSNQNYVGAIEVESYDFGILFTGQNNLTIDGAYFHDPLDDSAGVNACHGIYGSSVTAFRDTNVTIRNVNCINNTLGHAYQVKYSDRLNIKNMTAYSCTGVLSLIDCHDMQVDGIASKADSCYSTLGSFTMQSTDLVSQNPNVKNVDLYINDNVNVRPVLIISANGKYENFKVSSGFNSNPANMSIYDIRGNGNSLNNSYGECRNTAVLGVILGLAPVSAGVEVKNCEFKNVTYLVSILTGVTGVILKFDDAVQSYITDKVLAASTITYNYVTVSPAALSTMGEHATLNALAKDSLVHPVANQGIQVKVRPTRNINVSALIWYSLVQSGNYDIGIIDDISNVTLWSKGSTAWPAVGKVTETVPNIILYAGRRYRFTISADNNVGSYRGLNSPVAGIDQNLDGTYNATQVATVFPLPNPLAAGGTSVALIPLIIAQGTRA